MVVKNTRTAAFYSPKRHFSQVLPNLSQDMASYSQVMTNLSQDMASYSQVMTNLSQKMASYSQVMTNLSKDMASYSLCAKRYFFFKNDLYNMNLNQVKTN